MSYSAIRISEKGKEIPDTRKEEFCWSHWPNSGIVATSPLPNLAIYLARDLSGATCSKLGDFFGGVSGAAITVRYNKIAEEMAGDKKLKRKVSKIKARIIHI